MQEAIELSIVLVVIALVVTYSILAKKKNPTVKVQPLTIKLPEPVKVKAPAVAGKSKAPASKVVTPAPKPVVNKQKAKPHIQLK